MLVATGGSVVARRVGGERTVAADDLFQFHMTTTLEAGELLTEVRIPALPADTGYAFQEVARRHGDYALAGVCALVRLKDGVCTAVSVAACGVASKPTRLDAAEQALLGAPPEAEAIARAADAARDCVTAGDDRQASAEYRKDLAVALVRRTVPARSRPSSPLPTWRSAPARPSGLPPPTASAACTLRSTWTSRPGSSPSRV